MLFALPIVLLLGVGLFGLGWKTSSNAIHPPRGGHRWRLDDYPRLVAEEVAVPSKTGVSLAGRFFAGRTRATIILSHGYGGNQDELLSVASALHDGGFSVFTYDLRGCGQSGGPVTFGALERGDLSSVVDYVASRSDVDESRIGAFGFSMGGAATILAAARDPRIKAVVADSAWADVRHWLRPSMRTMLRHPNDRFTPLSLKLAELRTGIDLDDLRPAAEIAALSPRPIFLLHAGADEVVPPADGQQNFGAAGRERELWLVPGAAHGDTLAPSGPASAPRTVEFFQRALRLQVGA